MPNEEQNLSVLTDEEEKVFGSCLTLPEEMAEATDFKAEEAIKVDMNAKLPESFSLGQWIYKTSNQGSLGACFEGNSKILMGDYSYEKIKDIKSGEVIQTFEGPKIVTKTFFNGPKEMVSIKLNKLRGNKSQLKCTLDHKFYVYENGNEVIKQANELKKGDRLLLPIYNINEKDLEYLDIEQYLDGDIIESQDGESIINILGKTQSKLPKKIKLTNELLELFGLYAAEGNINFYGGNIHGITLTFHQDEKDLIEFSINELTKITGGNGIYTHQKRDSKAFTIKVNNSLMGILFNNIFDHLCYNKTIPDFIYNLPIERFRYFLHGLVNGDGYITKGDNHSNEIGLSITGVKIMNLVSNKLYFNGIPHSIEIRNNSVETQERADIYGIYLYGDSAVWLFPELLKHNEGNGKKEMDKFIEIQGIKYVTKPIHEIENIGIQDSYNIEVEGNHTYCVNRVKVHNCTSLGTTHGTQILIVRKNGVVPTTKNILTPQWKDLWSKMGHSTTKYDGGDYVETAVSTALKQGIYIEENGELAKFDGYAYGNWNSDEYDKNMDLMKRYLYQGDPIVWCVRGDKQMWNEMTAGQLKSVPKTPTGGHCIALVGWDKSGFWFVNSRRPNDGKELKSRFHVPYDMMKKIGSKFNYRYWILYIKDEAKIDPERLKKIKVYATVLEVLKKYYDKESPEVKAGIVALSQPLRKTYPEINKELPL